MITKQCNHGSSSGSNSTVVDKHLQAKIGESCVQCAAARQDWQTVDALLQQLILAYPPPARGGAALAEAATAVMQMVPYGFKIWRKQHGVLERVQRLLALGANPWQLHQDGSGWSPIMAAADKGRWSIVDDMLASPYTTTRLINERVAPPKGTSLLFLATASGSLQRVATLMQRGADPWQQRTDDKHWSPIDYASVAHRRDMLAVMIAVDVSSSSSTLHDGDDDDDNDDGGYDGDVESDDDDDDSENDGD